jgi:hypothetical protein
MTSPVMPGHVCNVCSSSSLLTSSSGGGSGGARAARVTPAVGGLGTLQAATTCAINLGHLLGVSAPCN